MARHRVTGPGFPTGEARISMLSLAHRAWGCATLSLEATSAIRGAWGEGPGSNGCLIVSRGPCRANLCRLRSGRCERGCLVGPSRSTALLLSAATARLLRSAAQRILLLLWSCAGRLLPVIRSRLSSSGNSKPGKSATNGTLLRAA